jgi:aspartate aminotransferase
MFVEGQKLKEELGPENVFDFTLGNPSAPPPPAFKERLVAVAVASTSTLHRYMPNAGDPAMRRALAAFLTQTHGVPFTEEQVVMTCGAAGALNVILKALLDPGDEVIILAPYFVEYVFYVDNHGGQTVVVDTRDDFSLDVAAIGAAITPRTKALIINSPNNPTGAVYPEDALAELGECLTQRSAEWGTTIYLLSDEPYRHIVYGDEPCPSVFQFYPQSILANSYSKELSIPGERLGYVAVGPEIEPLAELLEALSFCNRTLGFVNAPALMQAVVKDLQGVTVDLTPYRRNRDLLYGGLVDVGFEVVRPEGAFYLFPKTPIPDDVAFVNALREEHILVVPGVGFGRSGHIRLVYCVEEDVIRRALPGFARVAARCLMRDA